MSLKIWKLAILPAISALLLLSATFAASGENLSLSEQLASYKNSLSTKVEQVTDKLQSEYDRLIVPQKSTSNYQNLVCLKVIEDDELLDQINAEMGLLKNSVLQEYVDLNAKVFNLLNEYSVGLIDEQTYQNKYEKIRLEVKDYYENNALLIDKADGDYLQDIFDFLSETNAYVVANNELLQSLDSKITVIQNAINQFTALESGIFDINNALNLWNSSLADTLNKARNTAVMTLDQQIQSQIEKYSRRYESNPSLQTSYNNKKIELTSLLGTNLDSYISNIAQKRYDPADYTRAKEQVDIIKSTFYENDLVKCEKVLTTDVDLDGYVTDVAQKISQLKLQVTRGVDAVTAASNDGSDIRTDLLSDFQNYYTTQYNTHLATFKEFTNSQTVAVETNTNTENTTELQVTADLTLKAYTFDRPFEIGEISEGVKQLQILLTKLGYFNHEVTGKFGYITADAVYQFQIAKGILKGVAGETAQGYLGPTTRAALNAEMNNILNPVAQATTETATETTQEVESTWNIFLDLIYQLESRFEQKETFCLLMQKGLTNITAKIDDAATTTSQKVVLIKIKDALEIYLSQD